MRCSRIASSECVPGNFFAVDSGDAGEAGVAGVAGGDEQSVLACACFAFGLGWCRMLIRLLPPKCGTPLNSKGYLLLGAGA